MVRSLLSRLFALVAVPILLSTQANAESSRFSALGAAASPNGFVASCFGEEAFGLTSNTFEARFSRSEIMLRTKQDSTVISFEGADVHTSLFAGLESGGQVRRVQANIPAACQDRPIYRSVTYANLYRGVSLRFDATSPGLESEYRIEPGADPQRIRIRYAGASSRRLNHRGVLEIGLPHGVWREQRPIAWQWKHNGDRAPVTVAWQIHQDGTIGFAVAAYDLKRALIVDPAISYSTYLGNATTANISAATATAVDSVGNVYFAGWVEGNSLGSTAVGQTGNQGSVDAFLIKLNPSGAVIFITYFGGSGDDRALGLTVDFLNQPWITGMTTSTDLPLRNAFQSSNNGYRNAFIAEFNTAGGLLFSSYYGGSGPDVSNAITTDATGNVYVVGDTQSANLPLKGAAQGSYGGGQDVFAAKFSSSGAPLYETYLGGSSSDHGTAIAVDSSGNAYVTGGTFSPNFPVTAGVFQTSLKGSADTFVTKLNSSGNHIILSTFLGGTGGATLTEEQGSAIALDAQGNIYVAGITSSSDFPIVSPAQSTFGGVADGFVAKLNPTAAGLYFSTYLGGSGLDIVTGLAVDRFGAACVTGYTGSVDFPLTTPTQARSAGFYDAFVSILNPAGNGFYYSSYLGGSGIDAANAVAIDSSGNVFIAGQTASFDFPLVNPLLRIHAGGLDAFALKIATDDASSFIERTYFGVLGSVADPAGLTSWTGQLNQGLQTRKQAAMFFFNQAAVQSSNFYVTAAYISVLGRDPDYGGFVYWTALFRSGALATPTCLASSTIAGCSQLAMLSNFASSPEFQARFNAVDNTTFVTVVYQNVLGRTPDAGGLAFWVGTLTAGLTRAQLIQDFITSTEFQITFGNRIQVETAYCDFLLRLPTPAEIQTWTNTLNSNSGDVSVLVNALITSTEYKAGL